MKRNPNTLLSKEELFNLYITQKKSAFVIAKNLNIHKSRIYLWLKKYAIPTKILGHILTEEFIKYEYLILKKSQVQIAKEVGLNRKNVEYYLIKYNIPRRSKSEALKGIKKSETHCIKLSIIRTQYYEDHPEFNKGVNNGRYGKSVSEETKRRIIDGLKRKGKLRKNKPEKFLEFILNGLFSEKAYKYVGDGSLDVGGKNPDFIDINNKKIIELFGDYWHSEKVTGRNKKLEEDVKISYFAKFGYKTLIVWECELKDLYHLSLKLHDFNYDVNKKDK